MCLGKRRRELGIEIGVGGDRPRPGPLHYEREKRRASAARVRRQLAQVTRAARRGRVGEERAAPLHEADGLHLGEDAAPPVAQQEVEAALAMADLAAQHARPAQARRAARRHCLLEELVGKGGQQRHPRGTAPCQHHVEGRAPVRTGSGAQAQRHARVEQPAEPAGIPARGFDLSPVVFRHDQIAVGARDERGGEKGREGGHRPQG